MLALASDTLYFIIIIIITTSATSYYYEVVNIIIHNLQHLLSFAAKIIFHENKNQTLELDLAYIPNWRHFNHIAIISHPLRRELFLFICFCFPFVC